MVSPMRSMAGEVKTTNSCTGKKKLLAETATCENVKTFLEGFTDFEDENCCLFGLTTHKKQHRQKLLEPSLENWQPLETRVVVPTTAGFPAITKWPRY